VLPGYHWNPPRGARRHRQQTAHLHLLRMLRDPRPCGEAVEIDVGPRAMAGRVEAWQHVVLIEHKVAAGSEFVQPRPAHPHMVVQRRSVAHGRSGSGTRLHRRTDSSSRRDGRRLAQQRGPADRLHEPAASEQSRWQIAPIGGRSRRPVWFGRTGIRIGAAHGSGSSSHDTLRCLLSPHHRATRHAIASRDERFDWSRDIDRSTCAQRRDREQ
jgi:hypothetical protein